MWRFYLEVSVVVPHDPVIADDSPTLQMKHFIQLRFPQGPADDQPRAGQQNAQTAGCVRVDILSPEHIGRRNCLRDPLTLLSTLGAR